MFNRLKIIIPLLLLPFMGLAQHEVGFKVGFANYLGDLAPSIAFGSSRPAAGLLYRYNYSAKWKFRTGLTYFRLHGSDRNFRENETRNLSFRTSIWEAEFLAEYHLLPFIPGMSKLTFSPYIVGGFAAFKYQPQVDYDGTWLNLRDIGTEGQVAPGSNLQPYNDFSFSFPIGLGFKKTLTDQMTFGLEVTYRFTLTDYLDDVSKAYADPALLAGSPYPETTIALADRTPELGLERNEIGSLRGNPDDLDKYLMVTISFCKRLGYAPCYAF
ncbi:MAG: outer membrane beta-barrel protein [Bacteroidetes bacterium]|nr:outer membrane beta-barrel protein [Bacteroidota bacterium]